MIRLLSRGFLFSFFGLFIVHFLASIALQYAPDGTSTFFLIDKMNVEKVLDDRQNVRGMVLGNSHGDNISFDALGLHGYTLARAWGDIFETQYYLKVLVPRLPKLEMVFIPVSYFSLNWENRSVENLENRRSQIYSILPAWFFIKGDVLPFLEGKANNLFPIKSVVREDHWKGVLHAIISGNKDHSAINQILIENCDYPEEQSLGEAALVRVVETVDMEEEIRTKNHDIQTDAYAALAQIVEFLQTSGIRVVLFTPPYYQEYTSNYLREAPEDIDHMHQLMAQLVDEYNVEYYDFSGEKSLIEDIRLYKDSDHLNKCGKHLFSEQLLSKMNEFYFSGE
jgi:hypothetical protein